jgi:hypothetical protein
MLELASRALSHFTDAVQILMLVLIGVIMTGVGAVLAIGGRPEAVIPLLFGSMALLQLPKRLKNIYRDLTGNY